MYMHFALNCRSAAVVAAASTTGQIDGDKRDVQTSNSIISDERRFTPSQTTTITIIIRDHCSAREGDKSPGQNATGQNAPGQNATKKALLGHYATNE